MKKDYANYKGEKPIFLYLTDDAFLGPLKGLEDRLEQIVINHPDFEGKRIEDYKISIVDDGGKYERIFHIKLTRRT